MIRSSSTWSGIRDRKLHVSYGLVGSTCTRRRHRINIAGWRMATMPTATPPAARDIRRRPLAKAAAESYRGKSGKSCAIISSYSSSSSRSSACGGDALELELERAWRIRCPGPVTHHISGMECAQVYITAIIFTCYFQWELGQPASSASDLTPGSARMDRKHSSGDCR